MSTVTQSGAVGEVIVTQTGQEAAVTVVTARGPAGATGAQGDRAGLKYTFDDQTNAAAPSAGHLKFNSSTLSAVTRISIRDTDFDGSNTSALLSLIDDSTSTIKARVVIRSNSNADASHFNFLVTSVTDEGNHHHINGTYVSGSAFAANEIVTFDFYQTGDKGETGPNSVTTSTSSNLTGFISANGTAVSGATAGATAATANTLALRDATGGSNFGDVGAASISADNEIKTSGETATIWTEGSGGHIYTIGGYIQSGSTFKLYNGTYTTTLSHSPTAANHAIAFPDKDGTVAMIDAETHTGAHAFSSTTRPTSAGTGTPAATSLITLADSEDAKRAWISFHCTNFTGATNVKSGGTSESATLGFSSGQSSATNGNYNGYRYGTYMAMNLGGLNTTANFDRRTIFRALVISPNTASVTGEARYLWPVSTSYTTGRLTSKGIGFVFIGNKLYGHTHDGTTARITTQFVDFGANATTADCVADSNGSGNVSFYVNGTLLESLTGPTGTQNNARGVQANVQCVDSVSLFFNLLSFSLEVKI